MCWWFFSITTIPPPPPSKVSNTYEWIEWIEIGNEKHYFLVRVNIRIHTYTHTDRTHTYQNNSAKYELCVLPATCGCGDKPHNIELCPPNPPPLPNPRRTTDWTNLYLQCLVKVSSVWWRFYHSKDVAPGLERAKKSKISLLDMELNEFISCIERAGVSGRINLTCEFLGMFGKFICG